MRDLEEIVERLEHGDLPLEESLGPSSAASCSRAVARRLSRRPSRKSRSCSKKAGEPQLEDFNADETKGS